MKTYICSMLLIFLIISGYAQNSNDLNSIPKGQMLEAPSKQRTFQLKADNRNQLKSASLPVFYEDFESVDINFTTSGDWQIGSPTTDPGAAYNSSSNCAGTVLDGNYSNSSNSELISDVIQLPSLTTSTDRIALKFYEWFNTENGYDRGTVSITTDNGTSWTQLDIREGASEWRENIIYLDSYAGQNIKLRFHFNSDGSIVKAGWYVDDISVIHIQETWMTTDITSLDAQNFPLVYMNVTVDTANVPIGTLAQSNFQIYEDEQLQNNYFRVFPPDQGAGSRIADIVFLMDNSGSMDDEQAAVQANVTNFVHRLEDSGINFALGLCRFGQTSYNGDEVIEDNGNMTNSVDYFINNLWGRNIADGGTEPGYDALVTSSSSFNFRPGAQKIFIIITDEDPDQGTETFSSALSSLQYNSISLYALTTGDSQDLNPLATQTNGRYYNITDPFNDILADIGEGISNTYQVQYQASNTVFDARRREVKVNVNYNGESSEAFAYYTPGEVPKIIKTNATLNLEAQAQQESSALDISVWVSDQYTPFVNDVKIYYKTSNESVYSEGVMQNISDSTWSYTVPVAEVEYPALDYYIIGRDGLNTVSLPRISPSQSPNQIAVLPNVKPTLTHNLITNYNNNESSLQFDCEVVDNSNNVDSVSLFIRHYGSLIYEAFPMSPIGNNNYRYSFSLPSGSTDDYEYYIKAWDNFGVSNSVGESFNPNIIHYSASIAPWEIVNYTNSTQIYCTIAIEDVAAEEGDKVGAFVGNECRGIGDVVLSSGVAYSNLLAQGEDVELVEFKIWDASEAMELEARSIPRTIHTQPGGTIGTPPDYVHIFWNDEVEQDVELDPSWNLISFYVDVEGVPVGDVFNNQSCGNLTVKTLTKSWTNDPAIPSFLNTLTTLENGQGYFVNAESPCFSTAIGQLLGNYNIDFPSSGWALTGYTWDYNEAIETALEELINSNKLEMVKSMTKSYNPAVDPFLNTLTDLIPGEGYFINLNTSHSGFNYPQPLGKSSIINDQYIASQKWDVKKYSESTVLYGDVTFNSLPVNAEASLGVFVDDECRALVPLIDANGKSFASMVINGDKEELAEFKLLLDGNVYDSNVKYVTRPGNKAGELIDISFNNLKSGIYPNPFRNKLTVKFDSGENDNVMIEIATIDGKVVKNERVSCSSDSYQSFNWDGCNKNGEKCPSGIYLIQIVTSEKITTHKAILSK